MSAARAEKKKMVEERKELNCQFDSYSEEARRQQNTISGQNDKMLKIYVEVESKATTL